MSDEPGPLPPSEPPSPTGSPPPPTGGSSFRPRYDSDPPTSPRRGLPTWAWVILVILFILIGLPLLVLGVLFLGCYTGIIRF